ncbi:hypothetical protein Q0812_03720 [Brevundimonas sp. 2R-24]|uniref:Bulb-type lectin domain-containing protein n=1 Tax=Peiella sedimenti TaxID=3061083 RepID=A0ABT8SJ21_9CAUL|nr:hypothetical protein [Caulobacteraceae bacterium XZ-24]
MIRTASLAAAALAGLVLATPAYSADSLSAPARLTAGQTLTAANNRYALRMQTDCNLVLYASSGQPLWSSRTNNRGRGCYANLQDDGNLVVYDAANRPLWASNTAGSGSVRLVMQGDGNLVLYAGGNRPVWASNTVQQSQGDRDRDPRDRDRGDRRDRGGWGGPGGGWSGSTGPYSSTSRGAFRIGDILYSRDEETIYSNNREVRLRLGRDCNLVLETRRQTLWESRTAGRARNCSLTLERDGQLVLSDSSGWRLWTSGARASGDVGLVVQDDENLVLYEGRRAYWSTDTWRRR